MSAVGLTTTPALPQRATFDIGRPGDRYERHPGDVLRLALWATITVLLVIVLETAEQTAAAIDADVNEWVESIPALARELGRTVIAYVAFITPVVVAAVLIARRRWRRLITLGATALLAAAAYAALGALTGLADESTVVDEADVPLRWAPHSSAAGLAAAIAVAMVARPWSTSSWRRADPLVAGRARRSNGAVRACQCRRTAARRGRRQRRGRRRARRRWSPESPPATSPGRRRAGRCGRRGHRTVTGAGRRGPSAALSSRAGQRGTRFRQGLRRRLSRRRRAVPHGSVHRRPPGARPGNDGTRARRARAPRLVRRPTSRPALPGSVGDGGHRERVDGTGDERRGRTKPRRARCGRARRCAARIGVA